MYICICIYIYEIIGDWYTHTQTYIHMESLGIMGIPSGWIRILKTSRRLQPAYVCRYTQHLMISKYTYVVCLLDVICIEHTHTHVHNVNNLYHTNTIFHVVQTTNIQCTHHNKHLQVSNSSTYIHICVDGCEILHQLIDGKHPIIYRLSTIPGGAGFRNHPHISLTFHNNLVRTWKLGCTHMYIYIYHNTNRYYYISYPLVN